MERLYRSKFSKTYVGLASCPSDAPAFSPLKGRSPKVHSNVLARTDGKFRIGLVDTRKFFFSLSIVKLVKINILTK
ncbi:MAG: hypothetical protein HC862_20140 [Scytonema sp. RU_4_4]|nr:hypothetical protein [Scytonema sp. RU_4_4]